MKPFLPALLTLLVVLALFVASWRKGWTMSFNGRAVAVTWAAGVIVGAVLLYFVAIGLVDAYGAAP